MGVRALLKSFRRRHLKTRGPLEVLRKNVVSSKKLLVEVLDSSSLLERTKWGMTLTDETRDRFLAQPEILLQITEQTDLPTVTTLRTVSRGFRDLIDQYRNTIARALLERQEHYRSTAEPEVPETWDYLMRVHICHELAAICAAADRQPDNLYIGQEGIPVNEPFGNGLRCQIAKGFLVMWHFSDIASAINRINDSDLNALISAMTLKAASSHIEPTDHLTLGEAVPKEMGWGLSAATLVEILGGLSHDADPECVHEAFLRRSWNDYANGLSDEQVVNFSAAWRRLPQEFRATDFPEAMNYTNQHAWNFVPARSELDAEFWYYTQILRKSPRLAFELWQSRDDERRSKAWLQFVSESRKSSEEQISWAVETRKDLMMCSKLFSYRLRAIADQDFHTAIGRWMMGRYPDTYGPERDPVEVYHQSQLRICVCFGGGYLDPEARQKQWIERRR